MTIETLTIVCLCLPIAIGCGIVYGVLMKRTMDKETRKLRKSVYGRAFRKDGDSQ